MSRLRHFSSSHWFQLRHNIFFFCVTLCVTWSYSASLLATHYLLPLRYVFVKRFLHILRHIFFSRVTLCYIFFSCTRLRHIRFFCVTFESHYFVLLHYVLRHSPFFFSYVTLRVTFSCSSSSRYASHSLSLLRHVTRHTLLFFRVTLLVTFSSSCTSRLASHIPLLCHEFEKKKVETTSVVSKAFLQ